MLDLTKILKVGDRVYSSLHGDGIVKNNNYVNDKKYPLIILFENFNTSYTSDGKWYTNHAEPILFPSKDQRDWEVFVREREEQDKPKVGDLVLVWYDEQEYDSGEAALGKLQSIDASIHPYQIHTNVFYRHAKKVTWDEAKEYLERHCKT